MAVKIRLKRMGKIRAPFYRVVVMDSRTKRDGRAIEEIGKYHPTEHPSVIDINGERAQYWLAQGAQPTEAVVALFKVTGDWQKFKGLDGAEGTLQVAPAKASKRAAYDAALAAAGKSLELKGGATARPKKAAKLVEDAPAAPAAEASAAQAPAVPADDDALEDLDPGAASFDDLDVHLEGVASPELRDVTAHRRRVDAVQLVHVSFAFSTRHRSPRAGQSRLGMPSGPPRAAPTSVGCGPPPVAGAMWRRRKGQVCQSTRRSGNRARRFVPANAPLA